jgi:hypothetical protein
MADDLRETMTEYSRVKAANKELFADELAEPAMEKLYSNALRDDLRQLGVPEDRIPLRSKDLQDWHRFYRTQGQPVRDTKTLFNNVVERFREYRGAPQQQQQEANPDPAQPTVSLDRSARRATIPTQPARSAAPQRMTPTSLQPQRKTREQTLEEMRQSRKGRVFRRAG